MFDPVQNLKRQTCTEILVENLYGCQVFCEKILCDVVEAGYRNILRYAKTTFLQQLHQNGGNVVAGTDKCVRHTGQGGKEGINFLAVRIDAKRGSKTNGKIRFLSCICQSLAEALVSFVVGLGVADIADEADPGTSLFQKMAGDTADAGAAFHQKQITVQFIRGNERGSVQEHFWNLCLCEKVQEKVKNAIENMTGLTVLDVNIKIAGVSLEEK